MPIVRIDLLEGFTPSYKRSLLDSIHEALVYSFRIPDGDRNQTIREYSDANFDRSEGKSKQFTMIEISVFAGRSREAKRSLYARIVSNLAKSPGISATDVLISINEIELVNWGVHGGQVADEVDLGFQVKV